MDARNELKGKRGLVRLLNATRYSLAGYKAAWQDEEAFRQICLLAVIGLPLACRLGRDWAESVLLAVPLVLCLLVELLNSAIENVVDRISLEWHPLAKKAKDMGSAAQFTAQLFLAAVWGGLRFGTIIGRCGQGNLWLRPTGLIFVLRGKVEGHLRYRTGLPPYSFPGITAHPVTGPFGHPYRAL